MDNIFNSVIETERLFLFPLSAEETDIYATGGEALAEYFGLKYAGEEVDEVLAKIFRMSAEVIRSKEYRFPYGAFWVIIEKDSGTIVGSADFKTNPDSNGVTEVGYGLGETYRHKGIMTESLGAMCSWVFAGGEVKEVVAETEKDNLASINVLKRCGFTQVESPNDYYRWSLKKQ